MPNYQNGKIYKIRSEIGNCQYYGSTVEKYLGRRIAGHRRDMKNNKYISSYEVLKYEDAVASLVELYPCNSKLELHSRERYYIENNDCVNKIIPTRTDKEYREDNKEYYQKYFKKYHIDNKEKIIKRVKEYEKKNKEKVDKYRLEYRIKNRDKINKKHKQKYKCICGSSYSYSTKSRHLKTNKHKKFIG